MFNILFLLVRSSVNFINKSTLIMKYYLTVYVTYNNNNYYY